MKNEKDSIPIPIATIAISVMVAGFIMSLLPSKMTYIKLEGQILATSTNVSSESLQELKLSYPLKHVCACESKGDPYAQPTHYETDGATVLRGRQNNLDIGICQINLFYHKETAVAMGLDLFLEADNITYAEHLYALNGLRDWGWSEHCWGRAVHK